MHECAQCELVAVDFHADLLLAVLLKLGEAVVVTVPDTHKVACIPQHLCELSVGSLL